MHDIVIFSLLVVSLLRIIGIGIAIDFYIESKAPEYRVIIIGWLIWLIGGIFPLFSFEIMDQQIKGLMIILNGISTTLGIFVLLVSLVSNYLTIKKVYVYIYLIILVSVSFILYFSLGFNPAISFVSIYQQIMWLSLILLPVIKWKTFQERINKHIWYYFFSILILGLLYIPIAIITYIQGYSFGLYDADNVILISFNYGYLLILTVMINFLIVHLEYRRIQKQKYDMKDRYSHNLGNALQSIYTALELTETYDLNKEDEDMIRKTSHSKIQEAAELLKEIKDL